MLADRECKKRMRELAGRAAQTGRVQYTDFLTPAELAQAEICARKAGVFCFRYGGIADAERCVAAFSWTEEAPEFPVRCLAITWREGNCQLAHRDLLGALMALGIQREKLGDILVEEGRAFAFALPEMARYIAESLVTAGSAKVRVELLAGAPTLAREGGEPVRATVPSLRLDAVLGAAWNLPRSRAAALVSAGRVQVDYQQELRPDRQLARGMMLSVRGMGRAKVLEIGGKTKKNRTSVTLLRY